MGACRDIVHGQGFRLVAPVGALGRLLPGVGRTCCGDGLLVGLDPCLVGGDDRLAGALLLVVPESGVFIEILVGAVDVREG
jgi:hypothetical protein